MPKTTKCNSCPNKGFYSSLPSISCLGVNTCQILALGIPAQKCVSRKASNMRSEVTKQLIKHPYVSYITNLVHTAPPLHLYWEILSLSIATFSHTSKMLAHNAFAPVNLGCRTKFNGPGSVHVKIMSQPATSTFLVFTCTDLRGWNFGFLIFICQCQVFQNSSKEKFLHV